MTNQRIAWDKEYQNQQLVTMNDQPQADTLRFFKYLKKNHKFSLENKNILDLGCGTGRNANYLAGRGNQVIGIDISAVALKYAQDRAKQLELTVDYRLGDLGQPYEIPANSIDLALDVTASNSLNEAGRAVYLNEVYRVLKPGGFLFVRALAKEGNQNVKNLLKNSPGPEQDTYIIKEMKLTERVFTRTDFQVLYGQYFKILKLDKKSNYPKINNRIYKRDYLLAYLQK